MRLDVIAREQKNIIQKDFILVHIPTDPGCPRRYFRDSNSAKKLAEANHAPMYQLSADKTTWNLIN